MATRPDKRRRYYIRLADIPIKLRLNAAVDEAQKDPGHASDLVYAALHPTKEAGGWCTEPLDTLLKDIAA